MNAPSLNRNSPLPLYHQLAKLLENFIESGKYPAGSKIPSENQLVASYSVGRPTVRQAVDSLVGKGLVERRRGAGTFVLKAPRAVDLFSPGGTLASFARTGLSPKVFFTAPPKVCQVEGNPFNILSQKQALTMCRLSRVEDQPVLAEKFYLDAGLFASLEGKDLGSNSLSRIVMEDFHLRLRGGKQYFKIVYPDREMAELLCTAEEHPVLKVSRSLDFYQAGVVIYTELYCLTDSFVFTQTLGELSDG